MDLSLFLAKFLGIYLLIVSLDLLFRRTELQGAVKDFLSSRGLLLYSGSLSLLAGLAIVLGHTVYEFNWRGLITLLGYVLVFRGALRGGFPSMAQRKAFSFFKRRYWIFFSLLVVIGLYLTIEGFTHSPLTLP